MNLSVSTIDEYFATVPDWQRVYIQQLRDAIHKINPDITETIKWGVPVFMLGKQILFTTAGFKEHVKYNFILNGALLDDPQHLFNNGMESKKSRSIDLKEGDTVDATALSRLITESITKA